MWSADSRPLGSGDGSALCVVEPRLSAKQAEPVALRILQHDMAVVGLVRLHGGAHGQEPFNRFLYVLAGEVEWARFLTILGSGTFGTTVLVPRRRVPPARWVRLPAQRIAAEGSSGLVISLRRAAEPTGVRAGLEATRITPA